MEPFIRMSSGTFALMHDESVTSVGEVFVTANSKRGFHYEQQGFFQANNEQEIGPEWTDINWGTTAQGGFGFNLLPSTSTVSEPLDSTSPHGGLGLLYHPLVHDDALAYRHVTHDEFRAAVEEETTASRSTERDSVKRRSRVGQARYRSRRAAASASGAGHQVIVEVGRVSASRTKSGTASSAMSISSINCAARPGRSRSRVRTHAPGSTRHHREGKQERPPCHQRTEVDVGNSWPKPSRLGERVDGRDALKRTSPSENVRRGAGPSDGCAGSKRN